MKCVSYRGKKPRRGLTPEQAAIAAVVVIALVLLLTMRANSSWTGLSCREQTEREGKELFSRLF